MSQRITLPDPSVTLAKCPHCGAEVKITEAWYQRISQLVQLVNGLL